MIYRSIQHMPWEMRAARDRFDKKCAIDQQIRVSPGEGEGDGKLEQIAEPDSYLLDGHTGAAEATDFHACATFRDVGEPAR